MNYKMMGRFLAQIIIIEAVFLLPALFISLGFGEWSAVVGFLIALGAMVLLGGGLFLLCRKAGRLFGAREGFVCVSFSWITLSLLGALPFTLSGMVPNYIDAIFETVSGFTTTGASIIADVEALPKGLLYWRSFSNWLGGMGVLVFLLAIAPSGGKGFTMHLLRAESPGPDVGKLVPKMRQTAMILYLIYIVLTVIDFIFLLFGRMPVLDALCTAFSTAGTGGFGIKGDSFVSFSPYIQWVTTVFMFLFGVNFSCYYLLLMRQIRGVFKDEELRLYVVLAILAAALITINILPMCSSLGEAIRHATFQVSTIITTTGFSSMDFDQWPVFSKAILLFLMVTGACAGSTAGGLKLSRVLLLFKSLRRNIRKILNPSKVQVVRVNGKPADEQVLDNTNAYLAAYVTIIIVCFLLLSLDKFDIETNLSATLCCFNNIGPGLGAVGPMCNFAGYSDFSTIVLTLAMLLGRLEIFPILILLSRSTWRKH